MCAFTVSENVEFINKVLETDFVATMTEFLFSMDHELVKMTLFGLSNIAAGTNRHADIILRDETLIW